MTISLFEIGAALALASGQQAPQQALMPAPRNELERLILSSAPDRNVPVERWLKEREADPELVRRELARAGFARRPSYDAGCEFYVTGRDLGEGEELLASITICPSEKPLVLLGRGFFSNIEAPNSNDKAAAPVITTPVPPSVKP